MSADRVGVLGGGQLALMLAQAGVPLGIGVRVLDPAPDACARSAAPQTVASFDDDDAVASFGDGADVVTFEFEHLPGGTLRAAGRGGTPVRPSAAALLASQDRLVERRIMVAAGIRVPRFERVDGADDLAPAADRIGLPAVLKTRHHGYDGKGQAVLREPADVASAAEAMGGPCILDELVPFRRELSVIAARAPHHDRAGTGRDWDEAFYPLTENHHAGGILRLSIAPAPGVSDALESTAIAHARSLMAELAYTGVLAIEFFEVETESGPALIGNEFAPRVHNSGHWTIEGARTSQFAQHLLAITGRPLGETAAVGHARMVNLIGSIPDPGAIAHHPGVSVHRYGKAPREGRKLGHVTVVRDDAREADALAAEIAAVLS